MKKLLIGLCIFVGSANAMDVGGPLASGEDWRTRRIPQLVDNASTVSLDEVKEIAHAWGLQEFVTMTFTYEGEVVMGEDVEGFTWLYIFTYRGRGEIVKFLLENGANKDQICVGGKSPMKYAESSDADGLVRLMDAPYEEPDFTEEEVDEVSVVRALSFGGSDTSAANPVEGTNGPTDEGSDSSALPVSYLTYDEVKGFSGGGERGFWIDFIIRIATSEELLKDELDGLDKFFRENHPNMNVLELKAFTNGESIGMWLLKAGVNGKIRLENFLEILKIVGPDALLPSGANPFLEQGLYLVINLSEKVPEDLCDGCVGKAKITGEKCLASVRRVSQDVSDPAKRKRALRILKLFGPAGAGQAAGVDPVKPEDNSWLKKAVYASSFVALACAAWYYLSPESSDGKTKGVPLK